MTGQAPLFIPQDIDMKLVEAEIAATGVSAPQSARPGLLAVVNQAHADGIDLKIVVIDHNPPIDTVMRDIAMTVGTEYPDATILAMSPSYTGSYSTHFPRVTLEASEDHAKTGNAVESAQNYLHGLNTPEFPWNGLTIVLLIGVLAAAVGTRFLQRLVNRSATPNGATEPAAQTPNSTA